MFASSTIATVYSATGTAFAAAADVTTMSAFPDRVGHLPLHRARRVREEPEPRREREHLGRERRAAPVPDEHLGLVEHGRGPVLVERRERHGIDELADGREAVELAGRERVRHEPVEHRERDLRAGHVSAPSARLAAVSSSRSGRAL